jgi:hypothetical protein
MTKLMTATDIGQRTSYFVARVDKNKWKWMLAEGRRSKWTTPDLSQ